jgi:hypothetical protein
VNFDAFWQTHRRFILGFAGGAVLFFILLAVTGGGAKKRFKSESTSVSRTKRELQSNALYTSSQVATLENQLRQVQEQVEVLAGGALPPFRERFQVPPGLSPAQHYISLTGEMRDELVGWSLRRNCEVDESLGLPPVSPTEAQQIERVLRGLDVVDRVVRIAVESGAVEVEKIRIAEKRRRRSGRDASSLDITPVTLEVVFRQRSPAPFLRALLAEQDAGRPTGLQVLEMSAPDGRRQERRVLLEFGVGALPEVAEEDQA